MRNTAKAHGYVKRGALWPMVALVALTGCGEQSGLNFDFLRTSEQADAESDAAAAPTTTKLVERDVEAPDVFQVTDNGLWDGRPSLGGVWVAHSDVREPERVIIRNNKNGKFVIGALFRRERANPGPSIQVSSDAANALGMLAGAPAELDVTALRREETPVEEPVPVPTQDLEAVSEVEVAALDPVVGAAAAIEVAEQQEADAKPDPVPVRPAAQTVQTSNLEKPFIQIGIFSIEENARNTATAMRQNGMVPTVKKQTSQGKTFWRVIVGPAGNASERTVLLKKARVIGFADAYAVTN